MSWQVIQGDCIEAMRDMPENSVDSVVTDPPYGWNFMGKDWDKDIAFQVGMWQEVFRVLKPGGHVLAFGGPRSYHRMTVAIEDAGFEIRDSIHWIYGSGFPKSHDVSKAIDRMAGAEREVVGTQRQRSIVGSNNGWKSTESYAGQTDLDITAPATPEAEQWQGWGSALKPAHEPVVLARKPLAGKTIAANVLAWGTGAVNVDATRVGSDGGTRKHDAPKNDSNGIYGNGLNGGGGSGREINAGRWPANIVLDEDAAAELDAMSGVSSGKYKAPNARKRSAGFSKWKQDHNNGASNAPNNYGDSGGASRFFYVAKASRAERNAGLEGMPEKRVQRYGRMPGTPEHGKKYDTPETNNHPTVKPIKLMEWLVRLVTPPCGTILDPFTGSGSTGVASVNEGFSFIGIEREPEYAEIARRRIEHAAAQVRQLEMSAD